MVIAQPKTSFIAGSKARRAFTLVEIAIVLGIISAVVAGIWMAVANISEKNKVNRANNFIETTIIDLDKYMSDTGGRGFTFPPNPGNPGCGGLTGVSGSTDITQQAINAGIFSADADLLTSDPAYPIATPWGSGWSSNIKLGANTFNECAGGIVNTFTINFVGVPPDACVGLVMNNLQNLLMLGVYALTIANTTEYFGITPQNYQTVSGGVNISNITGFCLQQTPVVNVYLDFRWPPPPS